MQDEQIWGANKTEEQESWNYAKLVENLTNENSPLPRFEDGFSELGNYTVNIPADPTPLQLTQKLAQVQEYTDRVTQMTIMANNVLGICKRAYLAAYENHYTQVSGTVNEREYKTKTLFRPQYNLYLKAEEYANACKLMLDNLKNTRDILSRQITVLQIRIELKEIALELGDKSSRHSLHKGDTGVKEVDW